MTNNDIKEEVIVSEPVNNDIINDTEEAEEELTNEFVQAIIEEFDALHARLDNNDAKFTALISAVSSLTEVLKTRGEMSSATDEDISDMLTVIKGQRDIINAIITIPQLDDNIRKLIAKHLMSLTSWEKMEEAQKRLHNREAQKTSAFNITENASAVKQPLTKQPVQNIQQKPLIKQTQEEEIPLKSQNVQVKIRPDATPVPNNRQAKAKTSWGTSQTRQQPIQQKTQTQQAKTSNTSGSGRSMPPPIKITSLNSK